MNSAGLNAFEDVRKGEGKAKADKWMDVNFCHFYAGDRYYTARWLAAAQCIVIGPVCGFVCVCLWVCLFVGLLPR